MVLHDNFWREMNHLQSRMNKLFGNFWSDSMADKDEMLDELSSEYRRASPNFKETDKEFVVQVEVVGIDKENIHLSATDTGLEIRAEEKHEKKKGNKEGGVYGYTKRYVGFYHAFDVPDNADLENIDAFYKNRVLTIKLPKKAVAEKKKTIKIKQNLVLKS